MFVWKELVVGPSALRLETESKDWARCALCTIVNTRV